MDNYKTHNCNCSKKRAKIANLNKERCAKLRQILMRNPEQRFHYKPYILYLDEEFSSSSSESAFNCGSSIEIPWDDIAICDADLEKNKNCNETEEIKETIEEENLKLVRKESSGLMHLPWEDLLITSTVHSERAKKELDKCNSSMEIPWHDILFDPTIKIDIPKNDLINCNENEVEIPWKDLLIPKNIVLFPKKNYYSCKKMAKNESKKKCSCSRTKK